MTTLQKMVHQQMEMECRCGECIVYHIFHMKRTDDGVDELRGVWEHLNFIRKCKDGGVAEPVRVWRRK